MTENKSHEKYLHVRKHSFEWQTGADVFVSCQCDNNNRHVFLCTEVSATETTFLWQYIYVFICGIQGFITKCTCLVGGIMRDPVMYLHFYLAGWLKRNFMGRMFVLWNPILQWDSREKCKICSKEMILTLRIWRTYLV